MKTYKIIPFITVAALTIVFSACSNDAEFKSAGTVEADTTIVDCNSTLGVTPTEYTLMLSGDILTKVVTPTVVNTYHDANGTKTVCTEVGSALLIR